MKMGNKFSWVVEGDWLLDYTQLSIMRSLTSTWGNWKAQPESREIFLVGLPSWGTQNIQVCHSHVRDQMDIHSLISEYWYFVSFWWKSKWVYIFGSQKCALQGYFLVIHRYVNGGSSVWKSTMLEALVGRFWNCNLTVSQLVEAAMFSMDQAL